MGDVVNLNRFRKQKQRTEKTRQVASNRAKHGATKAERQQHAAARARLLREVEGHRMDRRDGSRQEDGTD